MRHAQNRDCAPIHMELPHPASLSPSARLSSKDRPKRLQASIDFKNAKARDQTRNPWLRAVEAGVSSAPLGLSSEMLVRLDERGW